MAENHDYSGELSEAIRERLELEKEVSDFSYMYDRLSEKYGEEKALKMIETILRAYS